MKVSRWTTAGVALALAAGAALRTWQWLAQTSLWFDELQIARNVRDRGMADLLGSPLDHKQIAPTGFLAAVEAATSAFGLGELALRLVPWLMSLLALVLVWRISRRYLSGIALVGMLLLFAVSPALTLYGASLKQYSGDIAWTLLMVLLATWTSLRFSAAETREYMNQFWAEGFAPFGDGVLAVIVWIPERLFNALAHFLVFLEGELWPLAVVPALLVVPGAMFLVKRHGWRGVLVLAPALAALAGGLMHRGAPRGISLSRVR